MSKTLIVADGTPHGQADPNTRDGAAYIAQSLRALKACGYKVVDQSPTLITLTNTDPGRVRVNEMTPSRVSEWKSGVRTVANLWSQPDWEKPAQPAQPKPDALAQSLLSVVKQMGKPVESAQPGIALDSPAGHMLHVLKAGAGKYKVVRSKNPVMGITGAVITDPAGTRATDSDLGELVTAGELVCETDNDLATTYVLTEHKKPVQEMRRATSADLGWDEKTGRYTDAARRGNR